MLVPESKAEKKAAEYARCEAWVKTQPDSVKEHFCTHGRYIGYKGVLLSAGFAHCDFCVSESD